jgi:hypothetical protein
MMKPLQFILTASALTLTSALSMAQTAPNPDTVTISGIGVPRHPYPMDVDEFYKFKGSYDLASGETLSLFNRGSAFFAKIGPDRWHRIVAVSPNTFVAKDHLLKIRLDPQENGEVTGELLLASAR